MHEYLYVSLYKYPGELAGTRYLFKHGVELSNNIRVVVLLCCWHEIGVCIIASSTIPCFQVHEAVIVSRGVCQARVVPAVAR